MPYRHSFIFYFLILVDVIMKVKIRKCSNCGTYTLQDICPKCGSETKVPYPPKFSPEDPYGEYRRKMKKKLRSKSY